MGKKHYRKVFAEAYVIAGRLVLDSELTEGQRKRLGGLLLDVLSEPDRYPAKVIDALLDRALEP